MEQNQCAKSEELTMSGPMPGAVQNSASHTVDMRVAREDALARVEEYSGVDMEKIFSVLAASKKRIKDLREEKSGLAARVKQLESELYTLRQGGEQAHVGNHPEQVQKEERQQGVEQERSQLRSSRKNLALQRLDTFISSVKARNMVRYRLLKAIVARNLHST